MERNILCRELGMMGNNNESTATPVSDQYHQEYFSAPFLLQETPGNIDIPKKMDEDNDVSGHTCYVSIDLKMQWADRFIMNKCVEYDEVKKKCLQRDPKKPVFVPEKDTEKLTAIFAPSHFNPAVSTDLIVYLHGHKTLHPDTGASIKAYLNYTRQPYFKLRETIKESGKNVLLIAPTLGPRSQYASLVSEFDAYMDKVTAAINEYIVKQKNAKAFKPGRLIIAAHSGGGSAMLAIANSGSKYAANIAEYWGFDSLYQGGGTEAKSWIANAIKNKLTKFYFYSNDTKARANEIQITARAKKLDNVCVTCTGINHFVLVRHFLKERLEGKSCINQDCISNKTSSTKKKRKPVINKEADFFNSQNMMIDEQGKLTAYEMQYHPGFETMAYGYADNEWTDREVPDPLQPGSPFHSSQFSHDKKDPAFFDFKKKVYAAHINWAKSGGKEFISDQPADALTGWKNKDDLTYTEKKGKRIYKDVKVHKRTEEDLKLLLTAAKSDAQKEGKEVSIYISNGYRSATTQFNSWDSHFNNYYERAINEAGLSRGDFSNDAAEKLAVFIRAKLGAPGYSNHQHGRAIDFFLQELNIQTGKKENFPVDTGSIKINGKRIKHSDRWRTTWFWKWLDKNAIRFGFCPYEKEPWHWEYWKDVDPDLKKCRPKESSKNKKSPAPATKAAATSSTKTAGRAVNVQANGNNNINKLNIKKTKKGYSAYGGGKLKTKLETLRSQGKLNITNNEIELLHELARTESSGLVQAINSWDSAYMSMGFAQFTFIHKHNFPYRKIMQIADVNDLKRIEKNSPQAFKLYFNKSAEPGKLQMLIQLAPEAFKKYGIELADNNIKWKDKKGNTHEVQPLKGLNALSELRSYDWAKKFYYAGLDDEVIIAQAKLTLYVLEMSLYTMQINIGNSYFISYYKSSPALRGLIQEAYNNRPAYLTAALKITSQLLLPKGKVSAQDFITVLKQQIVIQYDKKENDKAKGLRLTSKY
jgi:D-alanyl-D-alanine carboxypeptidase